MNFKHIASGLPVQPVIDALDKYPRLWGLHTLRQEFLGSPHHATECVFIRGPHDFTFEDYFGSAYARDYVVPIDLFTAVADVVTAVYQAVQADELGRVLIVDLPAGEALEEHTDEGVYAQHYQRAHVALVTNPDAVLVCNGEEKHIPAGEAWWFDHRAPHTAKNAGGSERLHLIVDYA
jgi:hypothetical protein